MGSKVWVGKLAVFFEWVGMGRGESKKAAVRWTVGLF